MVSTKDFGPLHYFLGFEISHDATGKHLSQTKCMLDLLTKFQMTDATICPTPLVGGKPISTYEGEALNNPSLYRSVVGALQYLSNA